MAIEEGGNGNSTVVPKFEKEPNPEIKEVFKSGPTQPIHNDKQILSDIPLHTCMRVYKCHKLPDGKVCKIMIKILSDHANKTKSKRRYYGARAYGGEIFNLYLDIYGIDAKTDGTYAQNSWLEFC